VKKLIIILVWLAGATPVFCQGFRGAESPVYSGGDAAQGSGTYMSAYRRSGLNTSHLPMMIASLLGLPPGFLSAFRGFNTGGFSGGVSGGSFRSGRFSSPVHFGYQILPGVSLTAGTSIGTMASARSMRLGAGVRLPGGVNFSAGYGLSNMGRMGYSGRTPGLQISAGYRLFGKKSN
jgi:hypothetical protein